MLIFTSFIDVLYIIFIISITFFVFYEDAFYIKYYFLKNTYNKYRKGNLLKNEKTYLNRVKVFKVFLFWLITNKVL